MRNKLAEGVAVGLFIMLLGVLAFMPNTNTGIADNVEAVRSGVVHIAKLGECQGSGAIISADGIVFTARHVTDGRKGEYEVTLDDGRKYGVKAVLEDTENDVAFFLLDLEPGETLPYVQFSYTEPRVGDSIFIMGSPFGFENFNSVTLGIVSAENRNLGGPYDWQVMMQTDSAANPGNSGGPVFNLDNKVIGVLVAGFNATLNFSVPVARFRDSIASVRTMLKQQRFQPINDTIPVTDNIIYGWNEDGSEIQVRE